MSCIRSVLLSVNLMPSYKWYPYHCNLSGNNALNRLFLLEKWAFCILAHTHYIPDHLVPTESLIQSLRLFPLPKLVCYFTYLFAQKVYNFLSPPFIYRQLKIYNRFSLRDKHILAYPTD